MRIAGWVALVLVALALIPEAAFAQEAPATTVQALADGERAEEALDFVAALSAYERAAAAGAGSILASRAAARAAALRARAEGGFEPLVLLTRARRDPSSAERIDELVRRLDAGSIPEGIVRVEIEVLAADAYAERLDRPADAARMWRAVLGEPRADAVQIRSAASSLVADALGIVNESPSTSGDVAAAEAVVAQERARLAALGEGPDERLEHLVRRAARRRLVHRLSLGVTSALGVLALVSIGSATRAGRIGAVLRGIAGAAPLAVAYAAYVGGIGGILAAGYEAGSSLPFLVYGAVLVPIVLLARAWGAAGSTRGPARAVRAAVSCLGALAAAFLVLESIEPYYLEGFGL